MARRTFSGYKRGKRRKEWRMGRGRRRKTEKERAEDGGRGRGREE